MLLPQLPSQSNPTNIDQLKKQTPQQTKPDINNINFLQPFGFFIYGLISLFIALLGLYIYYTFRYNSKLIFYVCMGLFLFGIKYTLVQSYDSHIELIKSIQQPQQNVIEYVNNIAESIYQNNQKVLLDIQNNINTNIFTKYDNLLLTLQNKSTTLDNQLNIMSSVLINTQTFQQNLFNIEMNNIFTLLGYIYTHLYYQDNNTTTIISQYIELLQYIKPLISLFIDDIKIKYLSPELQGYITIVNNSTTDATYIQSVLSLLDFIQNSTTITSSNIVYQKIVELLKIIVPIVDLFNITDAELISKKNNIISQSPSLFALFQVNNNFNIPILSALANTIQLMLNTCIYQPPVLSFSSSNLLSILQNSFSIITNINSLYDTQIANTLSTLNQSIYYLTYKYLYNSYCYIKRDINIPYIIKNRNNNFITILNTYVFNSIYTNTSAQLNVYNGELIFTNLIQKGANSINGAFNFNDGFTIRKNSSGTNTTGKIITNNMNSSCIQLLSNLNQLQFISAINSFARSKYDFIICDENQINIIGIVNCMPTIINKSIQNTGTSLGNMLYTNNGNVAFDNFTNLIVNNNLPQCTFVTNNIITTPVTQYTTSSARTDTGASIMCNIVPINSSGIMDNMTVYFNIENFIILCKNRIANNINSIEYLLSSITQPNQQYVGRFGNYNTIISFNSTSTLLPLYTTTITQDQNIFTIPA